MKQASDALGAFFARLPQAQWVQAAESTLRQLGLVLSILFVGVVLVYLVPDGFTAAQRFEILKAIGGLLLLDLIMVFILTLVPGDRLYAPYERILEKGQRYGTNLRR